MGTKNLLHFVLLWLISVLTTNAEPNSTSLQIVVPASSFIMGLNHPRATDEKPAHTITLSHFSIDRYEVTNKQFAAFIKATNYITAAEYPTAPEFSDGINWRHPEGIGSDISQRSDHPVVYVSWDDAQAYCAWQNKRLPTEAEWEKSARGNAGHMWPWGQDYAAKHANLWDPEDGYPSTAPVGSFENGVSPYGIYDLAGNVWEWCADWYSEKYYANSPEQDPQGPATGRFKILRGGSWTSQIGTLRTINRFKLLPQDRSSPIGFRCAQSMTAASEPE